MMERLMHATNIVGSQAGQPSVRRSCALRAITIPCSSSSGSVPVGVPRVCTRDTELPNGKTVKAGAAVSISYGGANVDPAAFEDPFEVRFDREVNPHIAFEGGVHRCLGSHLARRELRIALREWHRRIPEYRVKPGVELEYTPGIRSLQTFPMLIGAPAS